MADSESIPEEVEHSLRDRLKHPIFGSWVIAFLLVNWRAVYALLWPSEGYSFVDRLNWIDGNLYDGTWEVLLKIYVVPIAAAFINFSGVPWLMIHPLRWRQSAEVVHRNQKDKIDEGLIKFQSKITELNGELKATIEAHRVEMEGKTQLYENREQDLRQEIKTLSTTNGVLSKEMQQLHLSRNISEEKYNDLTKMFRTRNPNAEIPSNPFTTVEATKLVLRDWTVSQATGKLFSHSALESLVEMGLIFQDPMGEYNLTSQGMSLLNEDLK